MVEYYELVIRAVPLFWSNYEIYMELIGYVPHLMSVHRIISKKHRKPTTFIRMRISTFRDRNFLLQNGAKLEGKIYTVEICRQQNPSIQNQLQCCLCKKHAELFDLTHVNNDVHTVLENLTDHHESIRREINELKSIMNSLKEELTCKNHSSSRFTLPSHSTPHPSQPKSLTRNKKRYLSTSITSKAKLSSTPTSISDSAYNSWPKPEFEMTPGTPQTKLSFSNTTGSLSSDMVITSTETSTSTTSTSTSTCDVDKPRDKHRVLMSDKEMMKSSEEFFNRTWIDTCGDSGLANLFFIPTEQNRPSTNEPEIQKIQELFDDWQNSDEKANPVINNTLSHISRDVKSVLATFKGFS